MNTQNALLQSLLSKITNLEEQLNSTPPRGSLNFYPTQKKKKKQTPDIGKRINS